MGTRPNYWVHEIARTYYSSLHASSPYANALSLRQDGKQVLIMNVRYVRSEEVAPLFFLAVLAMYSIQFGFYIILGVDFTFGRTSVVNSALTNGALVVP